MLVTLSVTLQSLGDREFVAFCSACHLCGEAREADHAFKSMQTSGLSSAVVAAATAVSVAELSVEKALIRTYVRIAARTSARLWVNVATPATKAVLMISSRTDCASCLYQTATCFRIRKLVMKLCRAIKDINFVENTGVRRPRFRKISRVYHLTQERRGW